MELHVFYVPEGSWNYQLNTIAIEVVNKLTLAGFIRQVFCSHVTMCLKKQSFFFLQRKMLSGNSKILSEKYLIHVMDPVPDLMNTINR